MSKLYLSKCKTVILQILLAALLFAALVVTPARSQAIYGPRTPYLYVHLNSSFSDLVACKIDITGWQLERPFPPVPNIVYKDYVPIKQVKFYLNNQRWPTGVGEPQVFDPKTGTSKHWYDPSSVSDVRAKQFRKAIAYLTDKNGYLARILHGYGWVQETEIPVPALHGYTDYADLDAKGLLYHYNPIMAAATFDDAGFTQGTTPNPYYDPATPASAQYLRTDPRYGGDLEPLVFYIRADDKERRAAGLELTSMLRKSGIPVNAFLTTKDVCFRNVMQMYDYHLYTAETIEFPLNKDEDSGKWLHSVDAPDHIIYGMFHSAQYWGEEIGMSPNYAGFCDTIYDQWAEQAKYSSDFGAIRYACLMAQERAAELVDSIPLWCPMPAKAFKSGWTGLINERGYGIDNYWSFLNMSSSDNTIDWGLDNHLTSLNPVVSQRLWDWKVLGLIYDGLLGRDPFDLSKDFGWLAQSWSFDPSGGYAIFTLRPGLVFHNGDPVTPEDVKFSIEFIKACGPGVAMAYSDVEAINHVHTQVDDPGLGPTDVKVYYSQGSYWALHWAGYQPILNRNVWIKANSNLGWGYYRGLTDWKLFTNRFMVQSYKPWEYDGDGDGIVDLAEDGAGAWIFQDISPSGPISAATLVRCAANSNFYKSQDCINDYLRWSFHMIGDVDWNGEIDILDGQIIARALGTDTSFPWGTGWDEYNPDADINIGAWNMITQVPLFSGDGVINFLDFGKWGLHFGEKIDP